MCIIHSSSEDCEFYKTFGETMAQTKYSEMEDNLEKLYSDVGLLRVRFLLFSPIINIGYFAIIMCIYSFAAFWIITKHKDLTWTLLLILPFAYASFFILKETIKRDKKYDITITKSLVDYELLNLRKKLFTQIALNNGYTFTTEFVAKYGAINNIKQERNFLEILGQNKYRATLYTIALYCMKKIIDSYEDNIRILYLLIGTCIFIWLLIPAIPVFNIKEKKEVLTKILFLKNCLAETNQPLD